MAVLSGRGADEADCSCVVFSGCERLFRKVSWHGSGSRIDGVMGIEN